jgi:hypothetical protein
MNPQQLSSRSSACSSARRRATFSSHREFAVAGCTLILIGEQNMVRDVLDTPKA